MLCYCRTKASFSTSSIALKDPRQQKEAPIVDANLVIADEVERREREKLASTIAVPTKVRFERNVAIMKSLMNFRSSRQKNFIVDFLGITSKRSLVHRLD